MSSYQLNSGHSIPAVGLGTWNSVKEGEVKASVTASIAAGYKHIDCAWVYGNEKEV
jgi:diketogulonate reductase-like aldo/keto reductase